jgi:protein involved in polysaccharide export with SLBB domain
VMEVQVNETGDVRVPKVGMVRVLGLTPAQAEDKIGQQAVAGKFLVPKKDGSPGAVLFVRMLKQAEGNVLAPIGPGDRLQVRAFELMTPGQEYVTEVRVDEVGDIKLYGVGRMHVADLTTTLVEEKVGQLAVAGHLLAPKSATDPGPQVFARMLEKAKPGAAAVVAGVLPKVGVADTLAVNVYELVAPGRDYAVELQVDGGGKIKLRNLERMEVGGLTTVEIEEKIAAEAVKAGFLMAKGEGRLGPQVIVTLVRKAAEGERPATLRAGDRLQIEGFGLVNPREFYSATVTVDEAGDIEIPNVGTERVAGMMPWQVEEKIVEMAVAGGFLPKGSSGPIVNVTWLKKAATATTVGADDRP